MSNIVPIRRGRQSLEAWIHECMTDTEKLDSTGKSAKLTMMSLVHRVGVQELEIHTSRFEGREINAKDLANMFQGKAESYAQDLPGVQTYNLLAFWGDSKEPSARHPFLVNQQSDSFGGLATEGPHLEGRIQQDMRHKEALFQQVYRRQAQLDEYSMRMMELQANTILKLTRENMDAFDVVKEMMIKQADNDHARKIEVMKFERATLERRKWMTLAPPLVNTLLGREVFPQGSVDTALIESVADSLSQEDIMKLASTLKPEVVAPLMDRWKQIMEERTKTKALIEATVPPADPFDAAGDEPKKLQ